MAVFQDTQDMYDILFPFFNKLLEEPTIGPKIVAKGVNIRFNYEDPEACLVIDTSDGGKILRGTDEGCDAVEVDVVMSMNGDIAHRFWMGKVNLVMALTKGDMKAKGPIPKIMAMLPIIKDSYAMYKEYLKEKGREDLIS